MNKNVNPLSHFSSLPDYRDERYITHSLLNIVAISIAAIICGAKDWYDVEDFGKHKISWLESFLDISNGIPSHDTFKRFFGFIDPQALEQCFSNWVAAIAAITEDRIISLDGKTLCGSSTDGGKHFVHMVSAWCNSNGLVLGQQKVEGKSNEITAIPALLDLLAIKGCTITIDAMGCRQAIAEKIKDNGADYILAVKDNQKILHQDIQEAFENGQTSDGYTSSNVGHGRIETRATSIITNLDWICKPANWKSLYCLVRVMATRVNKKSSTKETSVRYYIGSRRADAAFYHNAIRSHWEIENKLHWVLDVAFDEDNSRKKADNSAQNFSLLNKIALNMLRHYEIPGYKGEKKVSIKRKRNIAAWANDQILNILFQKNQK
jgi:predicted transposase YbfD/YdcC